MKRAHINRLARLDNAQALKPIAPAVIDKAHSLFLKTGELPTSTRLAREVTRRALDPEGERYSHAARLEAYYRALEVAEGVRSSTADDDDWIRRRLFAEAINDDDMIKAAARGMLKVFARLKLDLSKPMPFEEEISKPELGSLGMHLLGFPECLIRAPYEDRARDVIARLDSLRSRIDDEPDWQRLVADAATQHRVTGELPENEIVRDAVLINRELHELMADVIEADDGHIC